MYSGDYSNSQYEPAGALSLQYSVSDRFALLFNFGTSKVSAASSFTSDITTASLLLNYSIFPQYRLNPFVKLGLGALNSNSFDRNGNTIETGDNWSMTFVSGAGLEYLLGDVVGLQLVGDFNYLITDNIDGVNQGKYNDYYWGLNFGINFYIGK